MSSNIIHSYIKTVYKLSLKYLTCQKLKEPISVLGPLLPLGMPTVPHLFARISILWQSFVLLLVFNNPLTTSWDSEESLVLSLFRKLFSYLKCEFQK